MGFSDPECVNVTERIEHFFETHHPRTWRKDPDTGRRYLHPRRRYTRVDPLAYGRFLSMWTEAQRAGMDYETAARHVERAMAEISGASPKPQPVENPNQIKGRLRYVVGGLFEDDNGPLLPLFCHAMGLFSDWVNGKREKVLTQCQRIVAAGFQGVRVLDVLGYYEGAWLGREVTPIAFRSDGWATGGRIVPATENYYGQKREFLEMLHGLGLRIMDDRGDLNAWTPEQKLEHMRENGRLYASMGEMGREVLAGLWACNESWQNGVLTRNHGGGAWRQPATRERESEAARMIEAFRDGAGWWPDVRGLSWGAERNDWETRPGAGEWPQDLFWWSIDPATVGTMHGNRVPNEHIVAHYLGYGYYDAEIRRRGKRTWNTEPVGGGSGVTVGQVNDPELLVAIALESIMTGQAWTHMSGNGAIGTGPIEDHPGFYEVPRLLKWLPRDLHTFDVIGHAGTRFRGTRILAAIDDPPTRADYAIHSQSGRFVMNVYGAGAPLPFERACAECRVIDVCGDAVVSDRPRNVGDRFTEPYRQHRLAIGRLA